MTAACDSVSHSFNDAKLSLNMYLFTILKFTCTFVKEIRMALRVVN